MICGRESKTGQVKKMNYCDFTIITKMPQVSMKARITVRVCVCVCKAYLCGGTAASKDGQCHCICLLQSLQSLHNSTFKPPDWYLNCSVQFMKNILLEQETIKLCNKCNFVENKTHSCSTS